MLIVPLDLAGRGIERQRAVGVKVVARPIFIIPVRSGIADAPDDGVGCGIVGAGHPGRTAAGRSRVVAVFPGFAAGLALARDRVGAPDLLLGRQISCGDPATDAVLCAGHACYRHVLDDQRRAGDDLTLVRIGHITLPGDLAGFLVGRDQPSIQRMGNDEIAPQSDAAVIDAATRHRTSPVTVRLGIHLPDQHAAAAMRVDLVDRTPSIGDVEEAVLGNRRAFEPAMAPDAAAFDTAEMHGPGDLQVLHVIAVDLLQRGEPVSRVILMMMKPVARLLVDVEQPFLIDLVCSGDCQCAHHACGSTCYDKQTSSRQHFCVT